MIDGTIIVTGADSGMGFECALFLAEKGYQVCGTFLDPQQAEKLAKEAQRRKVPLQMEKMDVTDTDLVERVVQKIAKEGKIGALIHFAGLGLRGFFEDLSAEEIRRIFEVNVFGTMAVTRAVLPSMREARAGRIVLTTSVAGRIGSMSISGYASTKFAVEGFGECLAQEMYPFGIQVSLLEPGLISTPHFTVNRNRAKGAVDPASPYFAWFCQHEKIVDDLLARQTFTTGDVARCVHRILQRKRQRLRYVVGRKAKLVVGLRRWAPGELFERIYFGAVRRMVTSPKIKARRLS